MKNRKIYLVLAIILTFGFFGCSTDYKSIRYQLIQLTGSVPTTATSITYINENGNTETIKDVSIPWEKTLSVPASTSAVLFRASLPSGPTYRAKIFVDGVEVGSSESSTGSIGVCGYW